jgi:hypothetical protein
MASARSAPKAIADADADFLREGVRVFAQAVTEAEVTGCHAQLQLITGDPTESR